MQEARGSSPLISTNNLGHLGGLFFFLKKLTAGFTAGFLEKTFPGTWKSITKRGIRKKH